MCDKPDLTNHYNYQELDDCECLICVEYRKVRAEDLANPSPYWVTKKDQLTETRKNYMSTCAKRDLLCEISYMLTASNDVSKMPNIDNVDFKNGLLDFIWDIVTDKRDLKSGWWYITAQGVTLKEWIDLYQFQKYSNIKESDINKNLIRWLDLEEVL